MASLTALKMARQVQVLHYVDSAVLTNCNNGKQETFYDTSLALLQVSLTRSSQFCLPSLRCPQLCPTSAPETSLLPTPAPPQTPPLPQTHCLSRMPWHLRDFNPPSPKNTHGIGIPYSEPNYFVSATHGPKPDAKCCPPKYAHVMTPAFKEQNYSGYTLFLLRFTKKRKSPCLLLFVQGSKSQETLQVQFVCGTGL